MLIVDVKSISERVCKSLFEELMDLFDGYTALYTPDFTVMKYISITDRGFAMTQVYLGGCYNMYEGMLVAKCMY